MDANAAVVAIAALFIKLLLFIISNNYYKKTDMFFSGKKLIIIKSNKKINKWRKKHILLYHLNDFSKNILYFYLIELHHRI